MSDQVTFSFVMPVVRPLTIVPSQDTIDESFWAFHQANPQVYEALRAIALWCVRNGRRMGIKAIYERVRWELAIQTDGEEEYRLNNNYTSLYARMLMAREPELAGFFETRRRRARGSA